MSEMEVYQTHLENLKNSFKEGFYHLGQAKYIMGASKLSRISYDSRMAASAVVAKPETTPSVSDTVDDLALSLEFLQISKKTPKKAKNEEAQEEKIRRRHKDTASEEPTGEEEKAEENTEPEDTEVPSTKEKVEDDTTEEEVTFIRDPLTWFGFLTPPALREAQGQFKHALDASISVVNARQTVEAKALHYEQLLKEKRELEELNTDQATS
ncbi:hypothetical protein K493DRAFT_336727 [Basidiobolus meristosporus CBS 931.73]|uniref:Vacuolar ATPase assembly protein VMA22 n=1 Tax=Basidiobolus meristosporus CBS 931.73 TaxID=1314790 RepID=A0A1Y1YG09_9FUNG|nr:hypothetical protein K493DRAFT_336727 [Basidiobolus meristosporus CBS 931.73]|eukprot:ORX96927.1 hypothetical protein K493DRAFT_336727 [Basidiobolus meristosporus CBS 931.73]